MANVQLHEHYAGWWIDTVRHKRGYVAIARCEWHPEELPIQSHLFSGARSMHRAHQFVKDLVAVREDRRLRPNPAALADFEFLPGVPQEERW